MPGPDVICLGETMALVTPRAGDRLGTASEATIGAAGAESNVAQYLANLGHAAAWASRVGRDPLGDRILSVVAGAGVDVRHVERDPGAPTGVFFKDPAPECTRVYYYRAGSAASRLAPAYLDRLPISSARLVHLSGVTPALSESCAATATALFGRARAAGVACSFDVNFRSALWSAEEASAPLLSLAQQADVVFAGLDEAAAVWGSATAEEVRDLIGPSTHLVLKNTHAPTDDHSSRDVNDGATVFEPGTGSGTFVPIEPVEVVEPVGAGDAFAAGYLSAWLRGAEPAERLRLGHRVAAFALRSVGDHMDASVLRGRQHTEVGP